MKPFVAFALTLFVATNSAAVHSEVSDTSDTSDTSITHALNRIGFGARPGDVERVRSMGLEKYIEQQLHPERIPDSAIAPRLAGLETLRMSSREIAEKIEQPQIEARKAKRDGEPATPQDMRANAVVQELGEQKILRAVYSERQLQEVLVDFWFNHF